MFLYEETFTVIMKCESIDNCMTPLPIETTCPKRPLVDLLLAMTGLITMTGLTVVSI